MRERCMGSQPEPVFRAVGELMDAGRVPPSGICIKLAGHRRLTNDRDTTEVARRYGVENVAN